MFGFHIISANKKKKLKIQYIFFKSITTTLICRPLKGFSTTTISSQLKYSHLLQQLRVDPSFYTSSMESSFVIIF